MSVKTAIIILIIIAVLGALFFVYLYYDQQLAISPANKSDSSFDNQINEDIGTIPKQEKELDQLTQEEKKQKTIDALERMKENEDSSLTFEEKRQKTLEALERMKESEEGE
jgi:regulatory protein YycI of two-component signal transduction system YycFG